MFSRLYPFYYQTLYRNRDSRSIIIDYLNRKKDEIDTFNVYVKIEGGLQLGIITCYRAGQWQSDDDYVLNFELGYEDFNDKENVPFVNFESYEDFKYTNQIDNDTNQK